MADDIITRDDNGDLAVNVVTSTEGNVPYNYDDCFTLDTNGRRALRVVGVGGGGGDSHNKGYFATQSALEEAYPTGEAGDYAIVGSTDTVWIWDEDNSEWIDSDRKGQVTSVNGQTGAVTVSEVPDQTGYSGRVLGTDGFVAGWVEPEKVQRSTMPQASEEEVGNIYQYVGTTDANYTNGYFYKCVSDGQDPATYSWTRVDVQPAEDPTDVLRQLSVMPAASSENQGDIVQYVGATTADYTNGYVYKCVQKLVHPVSIAFSDPDVSFNSDYALVFDEFVAAYGVPNYWEILDKVYVMCNDDQEDLWTIGVNGDDTTYIYKEGLTRQEVTALGFVLPVEPQIISAQGALSWSSENINKWVHIDLGAYVPSYSVLPIPSENNAGQVILYTGEPVSQEDISKNPVVAGKLYICKPEYEWNIMTTTEGQFTVNILYNNEFIEAVGEESGSMTFTAVVSGGVVSWEVDGEPADPADYNIAVYPYGTIEDGDYFVVDWERIQIPYAWWPVSSTEIPYEVPILGSDGWDDNNRQEVYAPNVTENNTVIVSPAPKSVDDYAAAGIVCVEQKYSALTFTCKTVPANDIELSIAII